MELRRFKDKGRSLITPMNDSDMSQFMHCCGGFAAVEENNFEENVRQVLFLHGIEVIIVDKEANREELAILAASSFATYQDTAEVVEFMIENAATNTELMFGTVDVEKIIEMLEHPASSEKTTHGATQVIKTILDNVDDAVFRDFIINYHDAEYKGISEAD